MHRPASLLRGWTLIVVCLALAVTGMSARPLRTVSTTQKPTAAQITARRAELQQALDAYAAGDRTIVSRTFHQRLDPVTRAALVALLGDRRAVWSPPRAAFTIEVLVSLDRLALNASVLSLIPAGRTMVMDRPNPIGADAVEDRFEMLWHQIALAMLQGNGAWGDHDDYVKAIGPRMALMAKLTPPILGRFALARAMNASVIRLTQEMIAAASAGRGGRPIVKIDAIALFEEAATDPSLRSEALVRGAYLESLLGHLPAALASLDRAMPVTDEMLAYAAAMIRAGVFDRQAKPAAAAEAYAAAQLLAPGVQVPVIGRAAALQRAGQIDDAVADASRARRLPEGDSDPWPMFTGGDARFINGWILELRRMLR